MRIRILMLAALLPLCSAVLVVAQNGETLFQNGLAKERIGGDIPGAIRIYERIVRDFASDKALAAKTMIQLGGCYEKLGQAAKAWPYYEQVINKYSDQKDRVVEARNRIAAASDARLLIKTPPGDLASFALSPDGRSLVFQGDVDGKSRLWLRRLDAEKAVPLPGTERASQGAAPFWSPDGKSIGFFAEQKLKRVDVAGGKPQTLADAPSPAGGAWGTAGVIVFAPSYFGPLYRVPASGGESVVATTLDSGMHTHRFPYFLPDGRHFLFMASSSINAGFGVGSVDSPNVQSFMQIGVPIKPVFVAPNHLVFAQYSGIYILRLNDSQVLKILRHNDSQVLKMGVPTDQLRTRQGDFGLQIVGNSESLTGEEIKAMSAPILLAKPVCFENLVFSLSASMNGPVAYRENSNMVRQMTWRDPRGKETGSLPDLPKSSSQCRMRISPDNRTVAFCNGSGIFLFDVMKSAVRKVADGFLPVWSPNGDSIALSRFSSPNGFLLYRQPIDGGAAALLLNNNEANYPEDWSRDGNFLLYMNIVSGSISSYDLLALPLKGNNRKPIPIAQSSAQEKNGRFSPNGRWVAYQSDELGKRNEVFLQPFPEQTSERRRASIDGGSSPEWGPEGNELYFLSPDNHLMAATVTYSENGRSVEVGKPAPLYSLPPGADYTVSADGQRFLIIEPVGDPPPIIVLPNWQYKK